MAHRSGFTFQIRSDDGLWLRPGYELNAWRHLYGAAGALARDPNGNVGVFSFRSQINGEGAPASRQGFFSRLTEFQGHHRIKATASSISSPARSSNSSPYIGAMS